MSKARNVKPKEDQQIVEAQNHCRRLILSWFNKHSMVHLEKRCLSDGLKGLELERGELKLLLLDGMVGDEFLEDRRKFYYSRWIENKFKKPSSIQQWHIFSRGALHEVCIGTVRSSPYNMGVM